MATGIARRVVPGQSPPAGRRNVRGLTRGIEAPICPNAPKLSSECGIIVRGLAPLQHQSWTKIPGHYRSALIERIKKRSRAGSNNRAKVPYNHCGGSLPFIVH
ncbi:hypothetical protein C5167_026457 [Papaver somniferum]|nr:hypothetical protein C5167_026457 [Papaver somniferum]